jgi:hypothetical protein
MGAITTCKKYWLIQGKVPFRGFRGKKINKTLYCFSHLNVGRENIIRI